MRDFVESFLVGLVFWGTLLAIFLAGCATRPPDPFVDCPSWVATEVCLRGVEHVPTVYHGGK